MPPINTPRPSKTALPISKMAVLKNHLPKRKPLLLRNLDFLFLEDNTGQGGRAVGGGEMGRICDMNDFCG